MEGGKKQRRSKSTNFHLINLKITESVKSKDDILIREGERGRLAHQRTKISSPNY